MTSEEARPLPPSAAAIVVAATLLLGWPSLYYPFGRDQGNYAYAGQVILDGGAPYRDVFVFKPPMTALVHAATTALFGPTQLGIRVVDLGWFALSAVLLAGIVARLGGGRVGAVAAGVALPLLAFPFRYWDLAQSDGWMSFCLVGALYLAIRGLDDARGRAGWWLGVGACLGLAVGFKYTAAAFTLALLPGLVVLFRRDRGAALRAVGWVALGGLAVVGALAAWVIASGGGPAFVDSQFDLVPKYVANTGRDKGWAAFSRFGRDIFRSSYHVTTAWAGIVGLLGAIVAAVVGPGRVRLLAAIGALWLLFAASSTISQGKFFPYHFAPLHAPVALLVGLAFAMIDRGLGRLRVPWAPPLVLAGAVLAVAALGPIRERHEALWPVLLGRQTVEDYRRTYPWYVNRNYSASEVADLAAWLRAHTGPDERVFHWGYEPSVNYLADRRTGSRFLYNYPFRVEWSNPAYRPELLGALIEDPPEFFVVGSRDATRVVTGNRYDSATLLRRWGDLDRWVRANYRLVSRVGRYAVYARNDRAPSVPAEARTLAPRTPPAPPAAVDED